MQTTAIKQLTTSEPSVCTFSVDVAIMVHCRCIHHWLSSTNINPGFCRLLEILTEDLFWYDFFTVFLLCSSISATDALVMSCLERITRLEDTISGRLLLGHFLLREFSISSVGLVEWVEFSTLAHSVCPWLVSVKDSAIESRIFTTLIILLMLVRVFHVADVVAIRERFRFNMGFESWQRFWFWSGRWSLFHVNKLWLPDLLVSSAICPSFGFRESASWSLLIGFAHDVLSGVNVWITNSCADELAKCLLGSSALVDRHSFVKSTLVPFLA